MGSSDLTILECTEQVLCRYVISKVTVGSTDFTKKISAIEWAPLHGLTNMRCPVAVQCRQNLVVEFRLSLGRSVLWEGACDEEFLDVGTPRRSVHRRGCSPTGSAVLSAPCRLISWGEGLLVGFQALFTERSFQVRGGCPNFCPKAKAYQACTQRALNTIVHRLNIIRPRTCFNWAVPFGGLPPPRHARHHLLSALELETIL